MDVHFLQSKAWQTFQEAEGKTTFLEETSDWHFLAILEESAGFKRLYCPYGPVATDASALSAALARLRQLAKEHSVVFLRVQPTGAIFSSEELSRLDLRPVRYSQPSHTWHLNLTDSEEAILAGMKQNNRNIYRNYHKKGLTYYKSSEPAEIRHLTSLLHGTAAKNHITIHPDSYLEAQANALVPIGAASLHFMRLESKVIAAALVYEGETTNYYAHAASSFEHRNLNAATALLGEIIFDAKHQGKKIFDLYGIAPNDDPQHRWAGFTAFKKSFGGYEVTYPETHELPIKPLAYLAYKLLQKLR